jgi:hypothetical protein
MSVVDHDEVGTAGPVEMAHERTTMMAAVSIE